MSYWSGSYYGWAPRKSAAQRRADAARKIKDAARRGTPMSPVVIAGRKIAHTFWGKAWCDNLERYRDFAYRLERGRSYVRSGSVIDLQIGAGKIEATVSGSSLYEIGIEIDAVKAEAWRAIRRDCAGSIGSLVDLLSGTLSEPVMVRLCADRTGLFPAPSSIKFTCSCPDYASMCKHVAATMYGVGVRLDHAPELLFSLRRVSADDLLASVVTELPGSRPAPASARVLAADGLAALFGIEMAGGEREPARKVARGVAPDNSASVERKPSKSRRAKLASAATKVVRSGAKARSKRKPRGGVGRPQTRASRPGSNTSSKSSSTTRSPRRRVEPRSTRRSR